MTKKDGYVRFKRALKNALNSNNRSQAEASIDSMEDELFKSATYKNAKGARVNFLKNRLDLFKQKITSPFRFNTELGMGSLTVPASAQYLDINQLSY